MSKKTEPRRLKASRTTGSGNSYWAASMFELASNPPGNGYNLIQPDGTPADYYPAFRDASAGGR